MLSKRGIVHAQHSRRQLWHVALAVSIPAEGQRSAIGIGIQRLRISTAGWLRPRTLSWIPGGDDDDDGDGDGDDDDDDDDDGDDGDNHYDVYGFRV